MSESTWRHPGVKQLFVVRMLDMVAVKGKREGVVVLELVAERSEAAEWQKEVEKHSIRWLETYREQRWSECLESLEAMQAAYREHLDGEDRAVDVIIRRIEAYREHGVPDGWNGVHVMQHK